MTEGMTLHYMTDLIEGQAKALGKKPYIFWENEEGKKFDMRYYFNKHIPMVQQKLGGAVKRAAVEQGLSGAAPGS